MARSSRPLRLGLLSALAVGSIAASPAVADPLVDRSPSCINADQLAGYEMVSAPIERIQVLGDPGPQGTINLARRARDLIQRERIYPSWHAILGAEPLVSPDERGRLGRHRLYVVPDRHRASMGTYALVGPPCTGANGRNTRAAVTLIAAGIASHPDFGDQFNAAVAHETFHAFQHGASGRFLPASWWHEATAQWAEFSLLETPAVTDAFQAAVFGHPELPTDAKQPPPGVTSPGDLRTYRRHQYGMFRLVQSIEESGAGTADGHRYFIRFLRDSFDPPGRGARTIDLESLDAALPAKFGGAVASFWTPRLFPYTMIDEWVSGPTTTPGAAMLSNYEQLHGATCCTYPSATVSLSAERWAVDTARLPLAPETDVVYWSINSLSPNAYVGIASGPENGNRYASDGAMSFQYDRAGGSSNINETGFPLHGTNCLRAREMRVMLLNGSESPTAGATITFWGGAEGIPCQEGAGAPR